MPPGAATARSSCWSRAASPPAPPPNAWRACWAKISGKRIGLRVRLQSLSGPKTRIEVVTEGVFARMILDDPSLEGVAAVLFDEFHERSLDADLGLALALDAQAALRPDLRLAGDVGDARRRARRQPDGRRARSSNRRAAPFRSRRSISAAIRASGSRTPPSARCWRALAEQQGSMLVFLPGQGEILRLAALLEENVRDPAVDICPLYGAMERAAQDRAIRPAPRRGGARSCWRPPSPKPRSPSTACAW